MSIFEETQSIINEMTASGRKDEQHDAATLIKNLRSFGLFAVPTLQKPAATPLSAFLEAPRVPRLSIVK